MSKPNALKRLLAQARHLPEPLQAPLISTGFGFAVRFAGTGGVRFEQLEEGCAVATLRNRRKVRNHIGTIHAAAMALLAETATGAVFGLSVPDTHLPLLKSMQVNYLRRAEGDLRAVATLSALQQRAIATQAKGDLVVPVTVTDASGLEPIQCQMTWAWVPKKKR
ncbi:MAG: hotdog fold domain-containing protein [Stenotrophobium sp.]